MSQLTVFRKKWVGGLDPTQVQDHLDKLFDERRTYQERVQKLEAQLSELQTRIKGLEEKEKAMKETVGMVDAYAKKIDKEAQERKAQVLQDAQKEAASIVQRAQDQRHLVEKEILRLQKQKQVVLSDIRGMCHRHLALVRAETAQQDSLGLLDEIPADPTPAKREGSS